MKFNCSHLDSRERWTKFLLHFVCVLFKQSLVLYFQCLCRQFSVQLPKMHLTGIIICRFRYFLLLIRIGIMLGVSQNSRLFAQFLIIGSAKFFRKCSRKEAHLRNTVSLAKPMFIILIEPSSRKDKVCNCLL